ncbi:hypothetical protein AGR4A_Lc70002 [Agrobacterium tumefaciens str. B6]|uniref:Uncharacterized protein n=1 Tax=Agrobacterium tumefaciens str. B6 TaxID=1183423 RepID=A0A822V9E5_AGRTU|nr:hypothetical protein AGR4A_Lc70002 [Agrobacterium tumefaciens str. B6]
MLFKKTDNSIIWIEWILLSKVKYLQ